MRKGWSISRGASVAARGDRDRAQAFGLDRYDVLVVELEGLREERRQLVAELLLAGVHRAVGVHQLVDHAEELGAVLLVEAAEELEAAELELGLEEARRVLALGDALGEVRLDLVVDEIDLLVEVLHPAIDHVTALLRAFAQGIPGALLDELLHVPADEELLRRVEVAVDVPERRQVIDDGVHLAVGDARVLTEADHASQASPAPAPAEA